MIDINLSKVSKNHGNYTISGQFTYKSSYELVSDACLAQKITANNKKQWKYPAWLILPVK